MSAADQHAAGSRTPSQTGVTVRLTPDFANALRTALETAPTSDSPAPAQGAGLLFGTTQQDLITVRAFRSFAFWDSRQNNSANADAELSGLELIGWCCVRHGSTGLLPRDVQFHTRHFPRGTDLMVILNAEREQGPSLELFARTLSAPLSTENFRWGSFQLHPETPITEPIDVNLEEKNKADDLTVSETAGPDIPTPPANTIALLPAEPSPRANDLLWVMAIALFVVAAGMTFAWAHARRQYLAITQDSQSVMGRTAPASGLRVQAEGSGDGALLSWNHNASVVRSARQGILHIHDGSEQRSLYLDPSDLASGSIMYSLQSGDAKFRLELLGEHGSRLSNDVQAFERIKSKVATDTPKGVLTTPKRTNQDTHESVPTPTAAPPVAPETTPNYVPAHAFKQVVPDTKLFAVSEIREGAQVFVQVRIDDKGGVIEAHVKNGTNDNDLLRSAALEAAKQWIFEPAKVNGKNIPSEHTIAFQFH